MSFLGARVRFLDGVLFWGAVLLFMDFVSCWACFVGTRFVVGHESCICVFFVLWV